MELTNALTKYIPMEKHNHEVLKKVTLDFIRILAPFAPHFSEEIWEMFGNEGSVFDESWPVFDEKALVKDEVEIAIQINGKIKERIMIPSDANDEEIKALSLATAAIQKETDGKTVVKVIVIKGRLVNIVVK
jgi:leucyl-tRNA synthetase